MKLYIFLTSLIRGVGGGHIYTLNKIHYLENNEYKCDYIHANIDYGDIVIEELKKYENRYDTHLQQPPYFYNRKIQVSVIDNIVRLIGVVDIYDEIIIESQTVTCALWGELLAEKIKARNFIFLLGEFMRTRNSIVADFWRFKLKRKELYGIGPKSIYHLLGNYPKDDIDCNFYLTASCSNSLKEIKYNRMSDVPNADIIIGSIGRIDKIFLKNVLKDVVSLAKKHREKTFLVLLIGGSNNSSKESELKQLISKVDNVKIYITGLIYPIPVELVQIADVYLSTSGSARISANLGITTISYDVHDFKPIGILGVTTNDVLTRKNGTQSLNTIDLLEDILFKGKYRMKRQPFVETVFTYEKHISAVKACEKDKIYYTAITSAPLDFKEVINKFLCCLLGYNLSKYIMRKIENVIIRYRN